MAIKLYKMKKKYTHIFFDLDNTLWDFKNNSRLAMQNSFHHFKLGDQQITFDEYFEVYSKHNHALWDAYRKKEVNKKDLIQRRFRDTFIELGVAGVESEKINDYYFEEMPKQKALYPGALETLEYLKEKRYQLFIITNGFKEVQHKKIEISGLNPFFKKVFTSEEIKTPKPGKEIFEFAITSTNAKKSESLMIGDDWDVDIKGAINFEIDSVYFSQQKQTEKVGKTTVFSISHLNELMNVL